MNKSPNPNSNGANPHQPSDELRQQLWELSYGLLDDEAAVGLRARIKSDPAIARLYAEVRLQTDLVAAASRVEDGSLQIGAGPDFKAGKVGKDRERVQFHKAGSRGASGTGWATNWLAVGGTVALLVLLTFGLLRPETISTDVAIAEPFFYTRVNAPSAVEGLPQVVELQTYDVRDQARPADLDVRLVDREGRETFREQVQTSDKGRGWVELPGEVVQPGSRIEVTSTDERGDQSRAVTAQLKIAEEQRHTFMLMSTPYAQPGDSFEFSITSVRKHSKRLEVPPTDELMVESGLGENVVQPMWTTDPSGVINGTVKLPESAETFGLAMRRSRGALADVKQKQDAAQTAETAAKGEVSQGAVSKDRAAKDEAPIVERYYFGTNRSGAQTARKESALERAIALQQRAVETRRNEESFGKSASQPAPRNGEKSGELSAAGASGSAIKPGERNAGATFGGGKPDVEKPGVNRPAAPGQSPTAASPAPPALAPPAAPDPLPPAPAGPAQPIRPTAEPANRPAAVKSAAGAGPSRSVATGDVNDGQAKEAKKSLDDNGQRENGQRDNRERDKELQNAQQPAGQLAKQRDPAEAESLAEQANSNMFRESQSGRVLGLQANAARELKLKVEGLQEGYAPGQKVKLNVRVVDEEGRPVAANVGVRVWNDFAARTTSGPLSLTDALAYESEQEWKKEVVDSKLSAPTAGFPAQRGSALAGFSAGGGPAGGAGQAESNSPAGGPLLEKRKELAEKVNEEAVAANLPANPAAPASRQFAAPLGRPGATALPADAAPAKAQAEAQADPQSNAQSGEMSDDLKHLEGLISLNEPAANDLVATDNRAQVQRDYELAVEAVKMQHNEHWQSMGRVLIWGSAGLLVVLGLLLIARQPLRTSVLIPAVGLCVVCLAVGVAWFLPREPAGVQLALLPATPPTTRAAATPSMASTPAADESLSDRDANTAMPPSPGETPRFAEGAFEAANGEAKSAERLKRIDRAELASGQGLGGFGNSPPAPVPSLQPAEPQVQAAPSATRAPSVDSAKLGAGAQPANRAPGREGEGASANQAAVEKSPADKPLGSQPETAKSEPAAPFASRPEKPQASPGTAGTTGGAGRGGGFSGGDAAGQPAMNAPRGFGVGGVEKKLAQTRLLDQNGLGAGGGQSGLSRENNLPAALFWRPLTPVDESGVITIEFTMPAAESEYRLLIDAIGSGRVGSTQELLICREAK